MSTSPTERGPVLYLTYHRVTPAQVEYKYALSTERFREHLAVLRGSLGPHHMRAEVTFDDGNRTQAVNAAPVLAEFGRKAIFFVTAGWTGVHEGSMSAQDIRALDAAGHTIAAHGLNHKLLTRCSAAELQEELAGAQKKLADLVGHAITAVSMPGGRYNDRVLEACAAAGYKDVFTSDPVTEVRQEFGVRVFGRYNVRHTLSAEGLVRLLDPDSGALKREQWSSHAKRFVRNAMGDDSYHRLWSLISRAKRPK